MPIVANLRSEPEQVRNAVLDVIMLSAREHSSLHCTFYYKGPCGHIKSGLKLEAPNTVCMPDVATRHGQEECASKEPSAAALDSPAFASLSFATASANIERMVQQ